MNTTASNTTIESIKVFMEECKRKAQARDQRHIEEFVGDDDDARSVATVVPHEPGAVDKEDGDAAAEHEDYCRPAVRLVGHNSQNILTPRVINQ